VIYRQISLCCEDVSVTKIPILKQNANVALVILKTVKAIKFNKDEFQQLANHAGDLIVGIWRSYKNAKVPEKWLSPPLRDILRGLLGNLYSMCEFLEEQVSTNVFFRMMGNAIDMQQINRYHQRLTITLDKFEIQSNISTNLLLVQLLEKQKEMSNQIYQGTGIKNTVAKRDHNFKAKVNKGSTGLHKGLDRATKKTVKKVVRKAGQHTPNSSSRIDRRSEPEVEPSSCQWDEESLQSITTPCKKTRRPINFVRPPTSNWPWSADHTTGNWTHSPCPAIVSFSSSGIDVIIN